MPLKAEQDTCPHRSGMYREYLGGMNTGDYACSACGLAISPKMWAELRRETPCAGKDSDLVVVPMICPVCGGSLHSSYSDWQGTVRDDGYCLSCGYEVHHLWRSKRAAK